MSARRALVLACTAANLDGVAESAAAITRLLRDVHGFDVRLLVDPVAAAVHAAFLTLFAETTADDVVVIYYAGHATVFHVPPRDDRGKVRVDLVRTADLRRSEIDDFRGVLGSELSRLIRALMTRTNNVTVLLDCCDAADLIRPFDVGLDRASTRRYEQTLRRAIAERITRSVEAPASLPEELEARAVIVAASASGGQAFPDPERPLLLFTEHLLDALTTRERAARYTWQEVVHAIRKSLRKVRRSQLPGVAGARFRFPFATAVGAPDPHFHPVTRDGGLRLAVGAFAGIEPGDIFDLYTFGWGEARRGYRLGQATAAAVKPSATTLEPRGKLGRLPEPLYARRVAARKRPLAFDPQAAALPFPADTTPAESFPDWQVVAADADAVADVRRSAAGDLDVYDHTRALVARLPADGPAVLAGVRAVLDRVARWSDLWRVLDNASLSAHVGWYAARWGVLEDNGTDAPRERLLADHAPVRAGRDAMFLRIENRGRAKLHARAFRIRGDRVIEPWTDSEDGLAIDGEEEAHLAPDADGDARTLIHAWPEALASLPPGSAVQEWVLVLLSDAPLPRSVIPCDRPARESDRVRDFELTEDPAPEAPRTHRGATRFSWVLLPYELHRP